MTEVVDERGAYRRGKKERRESERAPRREADAAKIPFSRTWFETERLNSGRLLTALAEVTTVKTVRGGEALRFCVPSRDRAKVVAICASLCYNYKIIKEEGILLSFVRALGRAGIVLGTLGAIALTAVYPLFVTEVEYGGDYIAEAVRVVEESGVKRGAFLPDFDGEALEKALLALDGVAFASVTKRGTHVYVDVRAERSDEHFVDVPTQPVTAKITASVTRVVVWSGTALVSYGDVVRPGDELIGAYVVSGEDKVPCPADGEVYGLTYRTATRFFPDTEFVREYGRTHTETRLSFSGKQPAVPESPFEDYVLEVSAVRNDFMLGYTLYTYTFTEVHTAEKENDRTENEMMSEVKLRLLEELPVGAKLGEVRAECVRGDGGVYVTVTAEAEEKLN